MLDDAVESRESFCPNPSCDQSWSGLQAQWRGINHRRFRGPDHLVLGRALHSYRVWKAEDTDEVVRDTVMETGDST
jgi:hypothetical protein